MKSEWASCMMSFSERMCSCCLVSTMCRFFRIFMAKVLFSSLLSWTCRNKESRLYRFVVSFSGWINQCQHHAARVPYQLDAAKASNPQGVDDVEVGQVEVEEKRVLCFVPITPGKGGKCGNGIKDDTADKSEDNPLSTSRDITSIRTPFICLQILVAVICQGCYYQGCGDFEMFG